MSMANMSSRCSRKRCLTITWRFCKAKGVSYVFGGRKHIDLPKVLDKLRRLFGIKRLLLEGGGAINGRFLAANLIDEMSVIVAPILDGGVGLPSLVDCPAASSMRSAISN